MDRDKQLRHLQHGRIITWFVLVPYIILSAILVVFLIGIPMLYLTIGALKAQLTSFDILEEVIRNRE